MGNANNRQNEDESDALSKFMIDDPIGKMLNEAIQSMNKRTTEWWKSVKLTLLREREDLIGSLDTISDVLEQLKKFDSEFELEKTSTPTFVLLGIIQRAQAEEAARGRILLPPIIEQNDVDEDDSSNSLCSEDVLSSSEFSDAKHIAKYAIKIYDASIFGWTENFVASKLGLENTDDIILKDFNSTKHPGFVVLTDHSVSSVILAIRGTYSIGDAILDIVCDEVPFLDGFAHHGMVDGANRILTKALPVLQSLLVDRFPSYKLRVTGHSLGAGTAELITMILNDSEWLQNIDIKCVALAPPPVYRPANSDISIEEQVHQNIIIFVNGNDCVPRLSLANCAWMISALKAVDNLNLSSYDQLSIIIQKRTSKDVPIIQPSNVVNENLTRVLKAIQGIDGKYQERFKYLNHPSTYIYYLVPENKGSDSKDNFHPISLVRKKAKYFSHLLLVMSEMIAHHVHWSYEAALDKVRYEGEIDKSSIISIKSSNVLTSNNRSSLEKVRYRVNTENVDLNTLTTSNKQAINLPQ